MGDVTFTQNQPCTKQAPGGEDSTLSLSLTSYPLIYFSLSIILTSSLSLSLSPRTPLRPAWPLALDSRLKQKRLTGNPAAAGCSCRGHCRKLGSSCGDGVNMSSVAVHPWASRELMSPQSTQPYPASQRALGCV